MKRVSLVVVAVMFASVVPVVAGDLVEIQKSATMGEPAPDKALVYFVRPAFKGKAIKFWAMSDEQALGVTKGKTYIWAYVEPGKHLFWSKGENISALELEVEAGKTYYLFQKVKFGAMKARVSLAPMTEVEAQEAISKCNYAKLTDEGRQRGAEIAAASFARAQEKAAKSN